MDSLYSYFTPLNIIPRWCMGSICGIAFITYYVYEVAKKPMMACKKGKFRQFLETEVPVTHETFWPTLWCFESRAQTLMASFLRRLIPNINYRREILQLKDGGEVGLDWLDGGSETSPIIIILPGITGASQADYIKGLVLTAEKVGIRTVVFNNRGIGGITLKTPRTYCAANTEDLAEVVLHVHKLYPNASLAATGISMGGLILGNYLAEQEENARQYLHCAMLISVPWDVFKGSQSIEKPWLNLKLNKHLASGLCRMLANVRDIMEPGPWDIENVLRSQTVREFDASFTTKQFGYKDVDDYYRHATLHEKIDKIKIPVLCLSAADDPFQPLDGIPINSANESTTVAIIITARGGHIGFMEGVLPFRINHQYMFKLFGQFYGSVFHHSIEDLIEDKAS
uniref:AB hydrolase-1 domain-containing protein n=1 Tax=Clastoptera arizonana TaxID=38151 RepID=A0A1B6EDK0_9HEMI